MDFRLGYLKFLPFPPHPKTDIVMENLAILCRLQIWLLQINPLPFVWTSDLATSNCPLPKTDLLVENFTKTSTVPSHWMMLRKNTFCLIMQFKVVFVVLKSVRVVRDWVCYCIWGWSFLSVVCVVWQMSSATMVTHNMSGSHSLRFFLISCFPGFGDYECKRIFHLSEHDICVSFLIFSLDFHQCVTNLEGNILFSYSRCPLVVLYLDSINKIYQNNSWFKHGLQLFHYYYGRISIF